MNEVIERVARDKTISTLEIAEMLETEHWKLLRKLDGTRDSKGIIETMNDNQIRILMPKAKQGRAIKSQSLAAIFLRISLPGRRASFSQLGMSSALMRWRGH